jgi:ribosomal protein L25 (general stress protein Ctc)
MERELFPKLNYVFYKDKKSGKWSRISLVEFPKLIEKIKKAEVVEIDIELLPKKFIKEIVKTCQEMRFKVKFENWKLTIVS